MFGYKPNQMPMYIYWKELYFIHLSISVYMYSSICDKQVEIKLMIRSHLRLRAQSPY